jgi:hypothetical protein
MLRSALRRAAAHGLAVATVLACSVGAQARVAADLTIQSASFTFGPSGASLVVAGTASEPLDLRIELLRDSLPAWSGDLSAPAGQFTLTMPAPILDRGSYVLRVTGLTPSGAPATAAQELILAYDPPRAGVVKRAWISTTRNGPPVTRLPTTYIQRHRFVMFAHFEFAILPDEGQRVVATWLTPKHASGGGAGTCVLGRVTKLTCGYSARGWGKRFILKAGLWTCSLRVDGVQVAAAQLRTVRG